MHFNDFMGIYLFKNNQLGVNVRTFESTSSKCKLALIKDDFNNKVTKTTNKSLESLKRFNRWN